MRSHECRRACDAARRRLSLEHINKTFGGLVAIDEFSLDVYPGEVVALVGDNGAGKSTLIKIIAGVHRPTRGRMLIDGAEAVFDDPSDAQRMGIQVVYQDLALADSQPVYMNMFLGRELTTGPLRRLDRRRMIAETEIGAEGTRRANSLGASDHSGALGRAAARRGHRPRDALGGQAHSDG